jgi:hypothetical protein
MCPTGSRIAAVLNIVNFSIDLAGVAGKTVANIHACSMAIASWSRPLIISGCWRPWISVAVTLSMSTLNRS